MDEDIAGQATLGLLANQHGHAIDHINEHTLAQHDGGDAVAQLELCFLVNTEGKGQQDSRIQSQDRRNTHRQRQRGACQLEGAAARCLHDQQFTVRNGALKHPGNGNKGADRKGNGQPERDDRN